MVPRLATSPCSRARNFRRVGQSSSSASDSAASGWVAFRKAAHGVLHGRIVGGLEVPDSPGDQDVEVSGDNSQLTMDLVFTVGSAQRREQRGVLEREIVLGVVVDGLEPGREGLGRFPDALVPVAVEVEVFLDEAPECGARG